MKLHRIPRRRFLGLSASAGALIAAPGFVHVRAAEDKASIAAPTKAAIIGHTGRGDYGHGLDELFQNRPGIELVGLADADATGRAKAEARLKPRRSYADYREMLEREQPRLVSVAPRQSDQHFEMVMAALRSGAHVCCEKPFTTTPAEADKLLTEASSRGLKIAVTHQIRLAPAVLRLKTALAEGLIGDLLELRGYGKQDGRAGGEDMIVLGTHIFDLMRLFAGDPVSCTARVLWRGRDIVPTDARRVKDDVGLLAGDEVMAEFAFARGVSGRFTSRAGMRDTVGAWGLELIGSKGAARINTGIPPRIFVLQTNGWKDNGRTDEWRPYAAETEPAGAGFPAANARLVDDWLKAIAAGAGAEPACSGRNGAWAVEMVMGIYQAALSGRRATFPLPQRNHPLAG